MKFSTFLYFFVHIVFVLGGSAVLYGTSSRYDESYTPGLVTLQTVLVGAFIGLVELEKWLKGEIAFLFNADNADTDEIIPPFPSSTLSIALDLSPIPDDDDEVLYTLYAVLKFLAWLIVPTCACAILYTLDLSAPVFSVSCVGVFTLYQACFVAYSASRRSTKL